MPILGWSVVLAVQARGIPDAAWRLDDLALVDSDPPTQQQARLSKDGHTWRLRGASGRAPFILSHSFACAPAGSREPLALYVPSVERNVEVFLNGAKVGDGGRLAPVSDRNRHR